MDKNFTYGLRISVRGEDFFITEVDTGEQNNFLLKVEGISELVKNQRFIFDTALDKKIEVIRPENTLLKADTSPSYRKTKLFIETVLRNSSFFSNKIEIGHKAAINPAKYQYDPTLKALKLPRPRILCADDVGLGKTIEVGIFLAEMIKRGKGQRILVIALKSILAQLQQELWNRFAIPLVCLDSLGVAKIQAKLPANKNPFDFYDKTIVSIDTLKNNAKFRHYLEKSRWDIIVIDECQTVANTKNLRGDLADFLAGKCESLILTSATPHNGKKENFANLIKMLEPTAIPRNGEFTKNDILKYYVRRFKKDVEDDVAENFKQREIIKLKCDVNEPEKDFLKYQQALKFESIRENGTSRNNYDLLFSIGLFKSYFSSPEACLMSINERISKVEKKEYKEEIKVNNLDVLNEMKQMVEAIISGNHDSKFQRFIAELEKLNWKGKKSDERILIFAERIETLKALASKLSVKFGLKYLSDNGRSDFENDQVILFHGGLADTDQHAIIDSFGKEDSQIKILLTSDAGSQGVNLHYFCNRMFNYDVPWSIITLNQRNGRIDRYGQKNTPYIYYLIAESDMDGLKTDLHIIDKLVQKEEEVHKTLGDATSVYKLYDPEKEETEIVEKAIITNDESIIEGKSWAPAINWGAAWTDDRSESHVEAEPENKHVSFYNSDFDFYKALVSYLINRYPDYKEILIEEKEQYLDIPKFEELEEMLSDVLGRVFFQSRNNFILSVDKNLVQRSIENARKKQGEWPKIQILYDLHPIMKWFMNKFLADIDKATALVSKVANLPADTKWYLFHGLVSNNLGQPVISDFFVVGINQAGQMVGQPLSFDDFVRKNKLTDQIYDMDITSEEIQLIESHKREAIDNAIAFYMADKQDRIKDELELKLEEYTIQLNDWYNNSMNTLFDLTEEEQDSITVRRKLKKKEMVEMEIQTLKSKQSQYYKNMTSLDNAPFLKLLAVFYN